MSLDFKAGEDALSMGAYPQAFEIFMIIERDQEKPSYVKCCRMVLDNQAGPEEIKELEAKLQDEMAQGNSRATYNYALILFHLGRKAKAREVLEQASIMGQPEAKVALTRLLLRGTP
jgi:hypothetical protein